MSEAGAVSPTADTDEMEVVSEAGDESPTQAFEAVPPPTHERAALLQRLGLTDRSGSGAPATEGRIRSRPAPILLIGLAALVAIVIVISPGRDGSQGVGDEATLSKQAEDESVAAGAETPSSPSEEDSGGATPAPEGPSSGGADPPAGAPGASTPAAPPSSSNPSPSPDPGTSPPPQQAPLLPGLPDLGGLLPKN